jgi:sugar-specific transcriptional regulator TrmB
VERNAIHALQQFGLNHLEAEVYLRLLSAAPMTAYRVAQDLAKPAANVYKAVEVLVRKGAILIEDGDCRLCQAVPMERFLKQAQNDFQATLSSVRLALSDLETPAVDERVYRIESAKQVFETAREMLEKRARKIAVIDAFPNALERIADSVRRAVKRGAETLVEAYAPINIPGAKVVMASLTAEAPRHWKGEQLNVIVDGREHLIALLSTDLTTVCQAVWSRSAYLSCIHHAGRACEHTLIQMLEARERGESPEKILELLSAHKFFQTDEVPGHRDLVARYAPDAGRRPAGQRRPS